MRRANTHHGWILTLSALFDQQKEGEQTHMKKPYFHISHFHFSAVPVKPKCDIKTEFDCGDGTCIPLSKVCDKKQDCPAAEDEPIDKCGRNECKSNNGGCSHICVDTPAGFYCDCEKGFELKDNRTCYDIDECKIAGTCSQLCTNSHGSFKVRFGVCRHENIITFSFFSSLLP